MKQATEADFKAQFGEDRILAAHFADRPDGFYVEVGAYNGVDDSNSYYFERLGWRGVLIEADPELAAQIRQNRPDSQVVNAAVVGPDSPPTVTFQVVEGWRFLSSRQVRPEMLNGVAQLGDKIQLRTISVPARTLDSILADCGVTEIDFMTIDIEGYEWDALCGLNLTQWQPRLLILERNRHFPDRRIVKHLHTHGYAFQRTTGVNDWFARTGAAETERFVYHARFWTTYYLPKYLTVWKPLLIAPLVRGLRLTLIRLGLFDRMKRLLRGKRGA